MKTAYFLDFEFDTACATLKPRFETEILVEKAVKLLSGKSGLYSSFKILDIGTGCGNIAISLTKYLPSSRIVALDISDAALFVAARNAKKYAVHDRIEFIKSNLFKNIKGRYGHFFDLIISNPPYISLKDFYSLPAEVKDDPYIALYGGRDGADFYRKIAKEAANYLKRNGILLMEIGYDQADLVKDILEVSGIFGETEVYKDYSGIDRIVKTTPSTRSGSFSEGR